MNKRILSGCVGAGNGLVIFILTLIYDNFVVLVCNWENHRYESEYENSLVVKSFVFHFFVSYINLFYYAFFNWGVESKKERFSILGVNFLTIIFTKSLAFGVTTNLIPYFMYLWKKTKFMKKWISFKREKKEAFVS